MLENAGIVRERPFGSLDINIEFKMRGLSLQNNSFKCNGEDTQVFYKEL